MIRLSPMSATTLGVLADTHIPDRVKVLPPAVLDHFDRREVTAILHAGDISAPRLLRQLGEIAPVYGIRGNTDLLFAGRLPWSRTVEFAGIRIGMAHGHGSWLRYIPDRLDFWMRGPKRYSYYEMQALSQVPDCDILVCGHTHTPSNYWLDGRLIFNPGSPTIPSPFVPALPPSIGFLHLEEGNLHGEIVFL